jgi:RNA polymerase sigma factor (sigma-70 family)
MRRRELGSNVREISVQMTEVTELRGVSDSDAIRDALDDPRCFALLFDRHYDAIARYLCRRAGRQLADELASETFLRAFADRAKYDLSQQDARPWLYGIATNLLRKHARTESRRRRAYARAAEREGTGGGLDGADGRADAAARGPAVAAALARLQPVDRDSLLLLALTDLDYEGIAIATGVPVGTVRSRLHRARRHLRIELWDTFELATTMSERSRS